VTSVHGLRRRIFDSLATLLLWQTLLLSVLPVLLIAVASLYISSHLIRSRFEQEAGYVSATAAGGLQEKADETTNTANLLAEFPSTGTLIEARNSSALAGFLLPMKSRLNVDVLDVTDADGTIIAATQDGSIGQQLPLPLYRQAIAGSKPDWAVVDQQGQPMLRAISPVRNSAGEQIGLMDAGIVLGPSFLRSIQLGSHAELALSVDDELKASTLPLGQFRPPPLQQIEAHAGEGLSQTVTIGGTRYLATFHLIDSHSDLPVMLAAFAPLAPIDAMTHLLWVLISALGLGLCLAVVLLTWRMARGILAPFRQLVAAALRIQGGDLSSRVEPRAKYEIRVLEVAFNTMIDSLGERERERASHEAELLHLASHDPLTGLPNRSLLEQALRGAVAEAARGTRSALLYFDLDQFKIVNDTLGHGSGDRLLVTVAGLVRSVLRSEDLLARLGGDEFAALLPGLALDEAVRVAERVRRVVDEYRFVENGQGFALGLSAGLSAITGSDSASEVLGQADIACYTAKSEGRNRVAVYEPEATALALLSGDGRWTVELKDALQEGRLHLVYQPVMRLKTGRIDHYETLIRLEDRAGALISPSAFIPAAERSGLIREIDHWVVAAALDRIQAEAREGNRVRLAVNLSGITLSSAETVAFIRRTVETKGIDPRMLIFEVTETALMTNLVKVRATIEALRAIGCHFALDDFGSGFSSFTYLAQLPVDSVKIDGSFVRDLAKNGVNQAIVRAFSNVTHAVGKESVAEWVEEAETLEVLRRLHVDLAQGYFIGFPADALNLRLQLKGVDRQPDNVRPLNAIAG
jgi:diguanylate cyclase (GGDEF)-like protein